MELVIGIDLGGTSIKLGVFDPNGNCLQTIILRTPKPATPQAVLSTMLEGINSLIEQNGRILAIGVGTPGPVDPRGRVAKVAINLEGWDNVPLAEWLENRTGIPTILANDANCAGLGEAWLGAGRDFQNLILLTLGTGVGGAIILHGKLFVGHQGAAGELGLITLNPNGPLCNSGNQGSLEQYTSIGAIHRRTGKDPARLGELAEQGDIQSLTFWQEYGRDLGIGLTSLIYVLTPQAIIIGGGISASFEYFLPAMQEEIERRVLSTSRMGLQILPAQLGNSAGMVGAAKLAWDNDWNGK
jgi:glucokinase